jgi:hypothetical protein
VSGISCAIALDEHHTRVREPLGLFSKLDISDLAEFLVVEDTNIHGHPVMPTKARGPFEALKISNNNPNERGTRLSVRR